jgi:hypothetical protein
VAADLTDYTGTAAPAAAERLLRDASQFLESRVFRLCWYNADATTGLPTNAVVTAAFKQAVCAQVAWWDEVGDSTGAAGVGWGSVEIGSVKLGRSVTTVSGDASPARQIAPQAMDALLSTDLTPDIFELGSVSS